MIRFSHRQRNALLGAGLLSAVSAPGFAQTPSPSNKAMRMGVIQECADKSVKDPNVLPTLIQIASEELGPDQSRGKLSPGDAATENTMRTLDMVLAVRQVALTLCTLGAAIVEEATRRDGQTHYHCA